jgi:hypothetical protein
MFVNLSRLGIVYTLQPAARYKNQLNADNTNERA